MLVDVAYYLTFGIVLLAGWAACSFVFSALYGSTAWLVAGKRTLYASLAATAFCSLVVIRAALHQDYSVAYVAQVTERALPTLYKVTSFWAGMNGSMLMWLLFLTGYAAVVMATRGERDRPLEPWMGLALSCTILFFAAMVAFQTNPLQRLPFELADGKGMNPALQNYWMAIHPPTLYLGYVGMVVPFAFAFGALASGQLGDDWIRSVRRWLIVPWLALGVGMIFGGHWAYIELGWGGYWSWDPVENASFMPWLAATAFLHSVMVQERRGMFKAWNLMLVMAAFALSVFGTFITRSGVVESVHSFARSGIGPWFLGFVVLIVAVSAGLLVLRWPLLRSVHRIDSLASREFSFMLNNLLFMSICGVTLFLTMYPSISEWATGERWTVGSSAYNEINGSMALLLLALAGIGPVIAWRKASLESLRRSFIVPVLVSVLVAGAILVAGVRQPMPIVAWALAVFVAWCILSEFHAGARVVAAHRGVGYLRGLLGLVGRNRRRYGGYIVHLAIAMFFVGVAGMAFRKEAEGFLAPGQSLEVQGHRVTYAASEPYSTDRSNVDRVRLSVEKGDRKVAELFPEFKVHHKFPEPEKDVAVHQTFIGDIYTILAEPVDGASGKAKIQVLWNPGVAWVWWSSYVLIFGTVICIWPERRRRDDRSPPAQIA